MRKFFKFCSYTLMYVLITFASAFGVIFISSNSAGGSGNNQTGGMVIAPQLNHIIERMSTEKAMDLNLQADIESGNDNYSIILEALVNLENGLENLEVDGKLTAVINSEPIVVNFSYGKGALYFNLLNGKFKIETANITDSITQVLKLLNVEVPELGMDLSTLDPNMILGLLSNLTETKGDNSITLKISLPIVGDIELLCDLNYSIKSVSLPKTSIEGTSISFSTNINYPEKVIIEAPKEEEYIETSELFIIAESLLEYLNKDTIGIDIALKYNNLTLNGKLSANLNDLSSTFSVTVMDKVLKLTAIDNVIYFEFGNINAKYKLEESYLITNLLKKHFGFDLPLDEITATLASLKKGNLLETIGKFTQNSSSTSPSDVDLSIIQSINKNENDYTIIVKGIGEVKCSLDNEKNLQKLGFTGFGFNAEIITCEPDNIKLDNPAENFTDMKIILPLVDALLTSANYNNFAGQATITIDGISYAASYKVSYLDGKIKAVVEINLFDKVLKVTLLNNKVYVNYSGLKVQAGVGDIETITNFLQNKLGIDLNSKLKTFIDEIFDNVFNPSVVPALLNQINSFENGLEMTFFDNSTLKLHFGQTLESIDLQTPSFGALISVNATNEGEVVTDINESEYTCVSDVLSIVENTIDYLNSNEFFVELNGSYKNYTFAGVVNYYNNTLEFSISANIEGNIFALKLLDNVFYAEIGDVYAKFDLRDKDLLFNFIQNNFGLDLNIMIEELIMNIKNSFSTDSPSKIDINNIIKGLDVSLTSDKLHLEVMGANVDVNIKNQKIDSLDFTYLDQATGHFAISDKPFVFVADKEYFDLSSALPYVEIVSDYIHSKQFNVVANASVYRNDILAISALANAEIDLTSRLQFYTKLDLTGETALDLEASIYQDYLYVDINELLLKINTSDLEELMVLALNMLGIDPSVLPFLKDIANGMDVNFDGITNLLPSINMSNPLGMLKILKGISLDGNTLVISLDGSVITNNPSAKEMNIKIETDGKKLKALRIENLYTAANEYFDLDIKVKDFIAVSVPNTDRNFIDISHSNELIKAIINTSELDYYEINGTLNIDMSVIKIPISMNVPVNVKVKLVDRKPEIIANIGPIPVIAGANDDTPYEFGNVYAGTNRMTKIYYKDEFVYIYRTENVPSFSGDKIYEKKLKMHIDEFLADPMFVVQYIVGFSDSIMSQISKAIETASNREQPINISNVIKEFTSNEAANSYTVKINLAELANNKDLDSITLTFRLVNNETTGGKNYLGAMDLSLYMPIAGAFELTLNSNDLTLVNIGKELDFTSLYTYLESYGYKENERWHAYDGEWKLQSQKQYTLTFVENGGSEVSDITAQAGEIITLPQYDDRVIESQEARTTYHFEGWYLSENFAADTLFTSATMPRFGGTLYAKWSEKIEKYVTVSFNTNCTTVIPSITKLEGSEITLDILPDREETIENNTYFYTFAGWYNNSDFSGVSLGNSYILPTQNVTLYAKWDIVKVIETRELKVYDNGILLSTSRQQVGEMIDFTSIERINNETKFYYDQNYSNEFVSGIMPSENLSIHIKNKYNVNIISNYGNVANQTLEVWQGSTITLPNEESYYLDDGTYTKREYFTFNGWKINGIAITSLIMPNESLTIIADWALETKQWFTLKFHTDWYTPLGWAVNRVTTPATPVDDFHVLQGEEVDLTQFVSTIWAQRNIVVWLDPVKFVTKSWGTEKFIDCDGGSGITRLTNVQQNYDLYACWWKA